MKGSRKVFSFVLTLALVFAMAVPVFADWPSFQNTDTNNGVITTATPTATPSSITAVTMPAIGAWTGVDAAPVIKDGRAYAVYNGGTNGARFAITNLTSGAVVDVLLDAKANNVSQLSTPYVTAIDGTDVAFVGTSYETQAGGVPSFAGWTTSGGVNIDSSGKATFSGTTGSIAGIIMLNANSSTLNVQTDLDPGAATNAKYTITLADSSGTYTLVPTGTPIYGGGYGTYATYNGAEIPKGTYTVTITVDPGSGTVTGTKLSLGGYGWQLNVVTNITSGSPAASIAKYNQHNSVAFPTPQNVAGEGQINTPISFDSEGYIYFGIWGGTHTYYQYKYNAAAPSNGTLNTFKPTVTGSASGFDDFYGAGAYSDGTNVYFGSDNSRIYKQSVGSFWTAGSSVNLALLQGDAGQVRSTVAYDGSDLYFTSKGSGSDGYLWKAAPAALTPTAPVTLAGNSTSTPVISDNGYVYVGWYGYDPMTFASTGGLQGVQKSSFITSSLLDVYEGDPVQSSPIVYTDDDNAYDWVYFTTNSGSGRGYCYRLIPGTTPTVAEIWAAGGASTNAYAMQGFASDEGCLVYGDDGNYLYIMH